MEYHDENKNKSSEPYRSEHNEVIDHKMDPVVASIKTMLQQQSSSSWQCSIFRVPKNLRSINSRAYTPQLISIGPFHHGRGDLIAMEEHKIRYLQSFFHRINLDPKVIVEKVRSWEDRVRECYAETIKMKSDKFVKLILVDGCFVVEYLIRMHFPNFRNGIDHLLHGKLRNGLLFDMTMLENQLPFFVLEGLFHLCSSYHPIGNISFFVLTRNIFDAFYRIKLKVDVSYHTIDHFVKLLWLYFIPPSPSPSIQSRDDTKYPLHPTATELHEAGVKFEKAAQKCIGDIITGITFNNGILEIPHIECHDYFETYLRNLIAFEQCSHVNDYITSFALFMDDLINTDEDVRLLVKGEIISNRLGSNKDVKMLFNDLCKHVDVCDKSRFDNVSRELRVYCARRRHRWIASLKHNYFNTPWASVSFAAAVFLLVLTFIQTMFSALSIRK